MGNETSGQLANWGNFNFGPGSEQEQNWYELNRLLCSNLEDSIDDDRPRPIPQYYLHELSQKHFRGLRVLINTGNRLKPQFRTFDISRHHLEFSLETFLKTTWDEHGWLQFWVFLLFDALISSKSLPPRRWKAINEAIIRCHDIGNPRISPLARRDDDEYIRHFLAFVINSFQLLELMNDKELYEWMRDVWFQKDVGSLYEFLVFLILGCEPPGLGGSGSSSIMKITDRDDGYQEGEEENDQYSVFRNSSSAVDSMLDEDFEGGNMIDVIAIDQMLSEAQNDSPWSSLIKPALRSVIFGGRGGESSTSSTSIQRVESGGSPMNVAVRSNSRSPPKRLLSLGEQADWNNALQQEDELNAEKQQESVESKSRSKEEGLSSSQQMNEDASSSRTHRSNIEQIFLKGNRIPRPICPDRENFQFNSSIFSDIELLPLRLAIVSQEKPYLLFSSNKDGRSFSKLANRLALYGQNPVLVILGPLRSSSSNKKSSIKRKQRRFFGGFAERGFEDRGGKHGIAPAPNCFLFGIDHSNRIDQLSERQSCIKLPKTQMIIRRIKQNGTANNYTLLNNRNTYQQLGLGFGGQQECTRLFLSSDDWGGHVLFSDRMYEEGHLFHNLPDEDSNPDDEDDSDNSEEKRISPPFKWDFSPVSIEVYGFGGERALEEYRQNAEINENARETHRKVDRAKLVENSFDREVLFEKTFSVGADRAKAEIEENARRKR